MKRERYKLDVSVFGILQSPDHDMLFIQRVPEQGFKETWSLPAGALDPHETLVTAVSREIREEVGVSVQESDLRLVHTMHCRTNESEWLGMFFLAENWDGTPRVMEPHKHTAIAWNTLENHPHNARPYIIQALELYSLGIPFSTYGWTE